MFILLMKHLLLIASHGTKNHMSKKLLAKQFCNLVFFKIDTSTHLYNEEIFEYLLDKCVSQPNYSLRLNGTHDAGKIVH
jgi:hypothetical protein